MIELLAILLFELKGHYIPSLISCLCVVLAQVSVHLWQT